MIRTILLLALMIPGAALAAPARYSCTVNEQNDSTRKYEVDQKNPHAEHRLADGIHVLEMDFWEWTLNLSLMRKGQVSEVLGGASADSFRLRSNEVGLSVSCRPTFWEPVPVY